MRCDQVLWFILVYHHCYAFALTVTIKATLSSCAEGGVGLAGKAQRLASQLRKASETESSNANTTVQTLQNYLMSNSNIQVFSLIQADGSLDDVCALSRSPPVEITQRDSKPPQ